jgi:hypothetical protein
MYPSDSSFPIQRNSFYYELFGNGMSMLSLNYEYSVNCSRNLNCGARIGYGFKIEPYTDFYAVPFELMLSFSKNKRHFLEMGLGLTYTKRPDITFPENTTYFLGRIGYRYQSKSGFLLRIGPNTLSIVSKLSSPFQSMDPPIAIFGGISIGYSFQNKKK